MFGWKIELVRKQSEKWKLLLVDFFHTFCPTEFGIKKKKQMARSQMCFYEWKNFVLDIQ